MKEDNIGEANLLHALLQPSGNSDNGAHAALSKHCLNKSGASLNTSIRLTNQYSISTHLTEHKQLDVGQDLLLHDVVDSLARRNLEELLKEERSVQVGAKLAHPFPDCLDYRENLRRLHNIWDTFLCHKSAELVHGQLNQGCRFLPQMAG